MSDLGYAIHRLTSPVPLGSDAKLRSGRSVGACESSQSGPLAPLPVSAGRTTGAIARQTRIASGGTALVAGDSFLTCRRRDEEKGKMKKIIGGKVFNTNAAKVLAIWQNRRRQPLHPNWSDHYEGEDLYRMLNGEYFILGYGARVSRYAPGRPASTALTCREVIQWLKDPGSRLVPQKHFPANTISTD